MSHPHLLVRARSPRARWTAMLVAAFLASSHVAAQSDEAARSLRVAAGLLERGLDELARAEYARFLAEHPDHAETGVARYGLAVSLARLARPGEAIAALEGLDPRPGVPFAAEALALRGRCEAAVGDDRAAAATFADLRSLFGEHTLAEASALDEAEARLRLGELPAATSLAAGLAQSTHGVLRDRAALLLALVVLRDIEATPDDRSLAADRLAALRGRTTPGVQEALVLRAEAEARRRLGDPRAIDLFREALASATAGASADELRIGLAVALRSAGRADEALAALEASSESGRTTSDVLVERSLALTSLGRHREALAVLEGMRGADGRRAAALLVVAESAYAAGAFGDADAAYALLLATQPEHPLRAAIGAKRGLCLVRLGRGEDGIAALRGSLDARHPPLDAALAGVAKLTLGEALFDRGEWAEAQATFDDLAQDDLGLRAEALLKSGIAAARGGDAEGAMERFDALLASVAAESIEVRARFERAQALAAIGRSGEADADFAGLLRSERLPSELRKAALRQLAAIAAAQGRPADAAAHLEALDDAASRRDRARALLAAGEWSAAAAAYDALAADAVDDASRAEAAVQRAIAWSRSGDAERALASFASIGTDTLPPELRTAATIEEAWCLRRLGRIEMATALWRRVAEVEAPQTQLGRLAALELAERAIADDDLVEAAARLTSIDASSDARGCALSGLLALRRGEAEAAVERLRPFGERWSDSPYAPSARVALGEALQALKRHDEAIVAFSSALASASDAATRERALLRLGDAFAASERWKESEEAFLRHGREYGASGFRHHARFGLGLARERLRRTEEAIEAYRAVQTEHDGPLAARAQFQIGECLFALGRLDEAVRAFLAVDLAYSSGEWSAAALFEAGRALAALGRADEALRQFETLIARDPESPWSGSAREERERIARQRSAARSSS